MNSAQPPGPGPQELLEIALVATRFYREGQSKVEIADALGISRFRVARLLDLALELGVVRIDIKMPGSIDFPLSQQLAEAANLRRAIVVETPDEPADELRASLGRVAADLLPEVLHKGDVLGVAWGRTVNAMTAALTALPPCSIVQLTGALVGSSVTDNAVELVRQVSEASQGVAHPIYVPLLVDDPAVAESLRAQRHVADTLDLYERIDIAIVPIGSWDPPDSQICTSITDQERRALLKDGVRADSSTVLFHADGTIATPALSDRMIGISGEQLRKVPEVIAVAGGSNKVEAIGSVLRAGLVTTLITNSAVATTLLERKPWNGIGQSEGH